jgi:predicted unusual protein kinase regulating ubiquinone biosynthesis (AarF/ABC1/UbiB family)
MSDLDELLKLLQATDMEMPQGTWGRFSRNMGGFLRMGKMILRGGKDGSFVPTAAELKKIVLSLSQLKGLAMKLGQMFSYFELSMPNELQSALSLLQTQSPSMPYSIVERQIRSEIATDKANVLLAKMEREPIAAASIGQVHRAEIDGQQVVVKVQYPEIEAAINSDFSLTKFAGPIASIFAPGANIPDFIAEVKRVFLEECDYINEAANQRRFYELYRDHDHVVIPRVFEEFSSRRVLVSEYIDGQSFRQLLASNPSQEQRDILGQTLFRFYIGSLFVHGLYNGDPHPGNYLFLPDQRVAILDYGCVMYFDQVFCKRLARLVRAVYRDDPDELSRCYEDFGMKQTTRKFPHELARDFMRSFFGQLLEDREQAITMQQNRDLRTMMKTKQQLLKLNIPKEFIFLFRIRFGLFSIIAELGSIANWHRLENSYLP